MINLFPIFVRKVLSERAYPPVVIADSSRESSSTDSVAHDMDPFTEPRLNPKNRDKQTSMIEEGDSLKVFVKKM